MSTPLAAQGPGPTAAAHHTVRELFAVVRLALFLPVNPREIVGRASTIAALVAIALFVWIAVDPLLHSRDLVFSWYAVPTLAWAGAGALCVAWLVTLTRPSLPLRRTLVLTLGALPAAMIAEFASWKLVTSTLLWVIAGLSVYGLAYFARGLRLLTGRHQPLALLAAALATVAFTFSLDYLQAHPRLWVRAEERQDRLNAAGVDWVRLTRAQFAQQSRIDADIDRFAPQVPASTDVFFLGFAGYGQEPIFAREIELAEKIVGDVYGSGQRSLRLINDKRDLERWALASEPGLRHALRKMGAAMGDEDVLFLVLSSHGDRDKGVRVSNAGTVTTRVDPRALDEMIREAGIGWRVIVVSACYSGEFVDTLADDRTIVISAASADRKSFGCNDSRWVTYFGEAFFKDALAGGGSLRDAFEKARAALEKKERADGIVPSLPRASFGTLIEARLDQQSRQR